MRTKNTIALLLITIILTSCVPATTSVPPIKMPTPTITFTVPIPTSTPTQIPPTPTETRPSNADYLVTSENAFPLEEVEELSEFYCTADFSNIIYTKYEAAGGTNIFSWVLCDDGGKIFLVPTLFQNKDISYTPLALSGSQSNDGSDIFFTDAGITQLMDQVLDALKIKGEKVKVRILIGSNSGSILRFADLFPRLYAATDWDEKTQQFILSGNPDDLPSIPGFSEKLLLAVRITITEPN